uniref:Transcription factor with AP2 domain(S) n=1 Tax=Parastrongyloides trichosuri TaxID=131310 RepID=A0A0N5A3A9_PARTI
MVSRFIINSKRFCYGVKGVQDMDGNTNCVEMSISRNEIMRNSNDNDAILSESEKKLLIEIDSKAYAKPLKNCDLKTCLTTVANDVNVHEDVNLFPQYNGELFNTNLISTIDNERINDKTIDKDGRNVERISKACENKNQTDKSASSGESMTLANNIHNSKVILPTRNQIKRKFVKELLKRRRKDARVLKKDRIIEVKGPYKGNNAALNNIFFDIFSKVKEISNINTTKETIEAGRKFFAFACGTPLSSSTNNLNVNKTSSLDEDSDYDMISFVKRMKDDENKKSVTGSSNINPQHLNNENNNVNHFYEIPKTKDKTLLEIMTNGLPNNNIVSKDFKKSSKDKQTNKDHSENVHTFPYSASQFNISYVNESSKYFNNFENSNNVNLSNNNYENLNNTKDGVIFYNQYQKINNYKQQQATHEYPNVSMCNKINELHVPDQSSNIKPMKHQKNKMNISPLATSTQPFEPINMTDLYGNMVPPVQFEEYAIYNNVENANETITNSSYQQISNSVFTHHDYGKQFSQINHQTFNSQNFEMSVGNYSEINNDYHMNYQNNYINVQRQNNYYNNNYEYFNNLGNNNDNSITFQSYFGNRNISQEEAITQPYNINTCLNENIQTEYNNYQYFNGVYDNTTMQRFPQDQNTYSNNNTNDLNLQNYQNMTGNQDEYAVYNYSNNTF